MKDVTPSPSPSPSPRKRRVSRRSTRDSLRSTLLTNGSESMEDEQLQEDPEPCRDLQAFVQLQRPLSDWVYWQRDAVALPNCWTRVFAVFSGALLWLYRYEDATAKSLLMRMRVTALEGGAGPRQLRFMDSESLSHVHLCMQDASAFHRWHSHVSTAVAKFPPVEEEEGSNRSRRLESAMLTPPKSKKTLWNALATAVISGARSSGHGHGHADSADNALVVFGRERHGAGKSLGERWKTVTATVKTAMQLHSRHQQPRHR
ncbi:hypothetical protein BBJ28_00012822 [Nothophytophthora sp. Chile5]|nr:hypothetical protein BBJ28_00012822 [Nothophytophthora sp. Chile5]